MLQHLRLRHIWGTMGCPFHRTIRIDDLRTYPAVVELLNIRSGPEVVHLISKLDGRKQLWKVPAAYSASVAVDFVVAVG